MVNVDVEGTVREPDAAYVPPTEFVKPVLAPRMTERPDPTENVPAFENVCVPVPPIVNEPEVIAGMLMLPELTCVAPDLFSVTPAFPAMLKVAEFAS